MAHKFLPHTLLIGPKSIPVADLSDASFAYQDQRDQNPELPTGSITIGAIEYQVGRDACVYREGVKVLGAQ